MFILIEKTNVTTYKNSEGKVSKRIVQPRGVDKWSAKQTEKHNSSIISSGNAYITCLMLRCNENVVCIDVDNKAGTKEKFNEFIEENNLKHIFDTYYEITPNGGYHFFFNYHGEDELRNKSGLSIDIIKKGICIMAPSSYVCNVTNDEKTYRGFNGKYSEESLQDIPNKLVDFLLGNIDDGIKIDDNIADRLDGKEKYFYNCLMGVPVQLNQKYDGWIEIGIICYNYFSGSEKGLQLWWQWSKQCTNFKYSTDDDNFDECKRKYKSKFAKKYKASLTIKHLKNKSDFSLSSKDKEKDDSADDFKYELTIRWRDYWKKWNNYTLDDNVSELLKESRDAFYYIDETGVIGTLGEEGIIIEYLKDKKTALKFKCLEETPNGIKTVSKSFAQFVSDYHKHLNLADKTDYKPNQKIKNIINLWQGIKAKEVRPYDVTKIQPILDHIFEIWANGKQDHYDKIMSWIKSAITKPEKKIGSVLLLIDPHYGCGKGIIINFLVDHVMGRKHGLVTQIKKILGNFNYIMANKSLIVVDEVPTTKEEYRSQFDTFKNIITEPTITVEEKYKPCLTLESYHNFIITSNNLTCFPIDSKDRRFHVFKPSGKRKNDRDYFDNLLKIVQENGEESGNIFYTYLLDFDDSHVNLNDIISTEIRKDIQSVCDDDTVSFINDVKNKSYKINIDLGNDDDDDVKDEDKDELSNIGPSLNDYKVPTKIKPKVLYRNYLLWKRDGNGSGSKEFSYKLFYVKIKCICEVKKTSDPSGKASGTNFVIINQ